jgi:hypothetical protein
VKEFFDSKPENCAFWLRHLDEACLNATVCACDALFAAYGTFPHSSSVLAKAALFEKLAIVNKGFLMAERVAKHDMGWILSESNSAALLELLTRTDRNAIRDKKLRARFTDYPAEHSMQRLRSVLEQLLAETELFNGPSKVFAGADEPRVKQERTMPENKDVPQS